MKVPRPAGTVQLLERLVLGRKVLVLNLPLAVSGVTLGAAVYLITPRCRIGTRPWPGNSELTLRIIMCKWELSAGNDGSTLALKPMGRVNWSPKQRVMVTCHCKNTLKKVLPQYCFMYNGAFLDMKVPGCGKSKTLETQKTKITPNKAKSLNVTCAHKNQHN